MSRKLHLHLDADISSKALHSALLKLGHNVTRTPTDWMPLDASDEEQLLGATAQGRAIFTTTSVISHFWQIVIHNMAASSWLFSKV